MLSLEEKKRAIIQYYLHQKILPPSELTTSLQISDRVQELYVSLVCSSNSQLLQSPVQVSQLTVTNTISPIIDSAPVKIIFNYTTPPKKWVPQDFVQYFNARYKKLAGMLQQRQDLQNLSSIARVLQKKEKEKSAIIGMVADKKLTKNENFIITVEDPSGIIKVIVSKSKSQAYELAKDIVFDEVIGINGSVGKQCLFADSIILPDIPASSELKKAPEEVYAAALSCLHVGSTKFLREEFIKFTSWLRGEVGSPEQRAMAEKTKYIFIVGDMVDGIGIYPGHERNLLIKDIFEQYAEAARLFSRIPCDKKLILMSGNHDASRQGEPQPPPYKDVAKPLYDLPNALLLSNPCMVNIHSSKDFPGFNVLCYHGFSFIKYADTVPGLKVGKSVSDRVAEVMRFLIQRRHLAPTHASTLYIPDPEQDPLVIETIPDLFISGHLHKSSVSSYRGVLLVSASCF
ncbi:MAG: metallophosphoesterase, partial [Candidatus Woesearchaeota archaeon]|nr:metallophosphoesterase [Candidatus Woesearchaeota archaeon]